MTEQSNAERPVEQPVGLDDCPGCGVDLIGEPIPEEWRNRYYGGATHYTRRIGIEPRGLDRVTHWRCPECGHEWPA